MHESPRGRHDAHSERHGSGRRGLPARAPARVARRAAAAREGRADSAGARGSARAPAGEQPDRVPEPGGRGARRRHAGIASWRSISSCGAAACSTTCSPRRRRLLDMFERGARFSAIVNEGVVQEFVDGRRTRASRCAISGVKRQDDRHQIEFWLAALLRICRHATGRQLKPALRAPDSLPRQGPRGVVERFMGCEVEFGATADEILFTREDGQLPHRSMPIRTSTGCWSRSASETLARQPARGGFVRGAGRECARAAAAAWQGARRAHRRRVRHEPAHLCAPPGG